MRGSIVGQGQVRGLHTIFTRETRQIPSLQPSVLALTELQKPLPWGGKADMGAVRVNLHLSSRTVNAQRYIGRLSGTTIRNLLEIPAELSSFHTLERYKRFN